MRVSKSTSQPKSLATLRSHHLKEAIDSVVVFTVAGLVFWALKFGTGASPSVPQVLVTVMVPVALLKEFFLYTSAVKRLGFIEVPRSRMAVV